MPKTVTLTGHFLDPSKTPLKGTIDIVPLPEMVVAPEEDAVYLGPATLTLDENGTATQQLIVTENWLYQIIFNLTTADDRRIDVKTKHAYLTEDTDLADILETHIENGIRRPVLTYSKYQPGEVIAAGVTPDPDDTGAILAPVTA